MLFCMQNIDAGTQGHIQMCFSAQRVNRGTKTCSNIPSVLCGDCLLSHIALFRPGCRVTTGGQQGGTPATTTATLHDGFMLYYIFCQTSSPLLDNPLFSKHFICLLLPLLPSFVPVIIACSHPLRLPLEKSFTDQSGAGYLLSVLHGYANPPSWAAGTRWVLHT